MYGVIVFKSVRDIMRVIVATCRYVSDVDFTTGAWPRSHAGIDPMPDNMNLDYLKSDFLRKSRIGRHSRKIDFSYISPKHTFE